MKIDYNEASKTYDHSRNQNEDLVALFDGKMHFSANTRVLDFGCGTGNYLHAIRERFKAECYGVEPSDGMREAALRKNPGMVIRNGDDGAIPFEDRFFDFIYMTDVIHHVRDLERLFRHIERKLKEGGKVCIVTESHEQIASRWFNAYFESLEGNEKKRYPDIPRIVGSAGSCGLDEVELEIKPSPDRNVIDEAFIKLVEEKNYSMFRMLADGEYANGLRSLKADIGKEIPSKGHGETLVWLGRP